MRPSNVDKFCIKFSQFPNGGLIKHAKEWFNFDNKPSFRMRISEQVKWQLYHAANSNILNKKQVQVHSDFGSGHLNPQDRARLYRIIHSFQKTLGDEKTTRSQSFLQAKLINLMDHQIFSDFLSRPVYASQTMSALAQEDDAQLGLPLFRLQQLGSLFTEYSHGDAKARALTFLDDFYHKIDSLSPEDAANRFYFFMKVMDKMFPDKEIFQYFFDYHLHGQIAVAPDFKGLRLLVDHFNQKPPYQGKLDSVLLVDRSDLTAQLDLLATQGFNGDKKIMVLRRGHFGGHYSTVFLRKIGNEIVYIISDSGGGSAKGWVDSICQKIKRSKLYSSQTQLIAFTPARQSDGVSCSIAAFRDVLESCKLDLFHFVGELPSEKKPYNKEKQVFFVQNYPPSFMKFKQSINYLDKYLEEVPYAQTSPVTRKGATLSDVVKKYTVTTAEGWKKNTYLSKRGFKYFTFLMKTLLKD